MNRGTQGYDKNTQKVSKFLLILVLNMLIINYGVTVRS